MAAYMASRIITGAFGENSYNYVMERRPDLKEGVDAYLISKEREDLITQ